MSPEESNTPQKREYQKPKMEIEVMDRFFFICGMNTMTCGGPSDNIQRSMGMSQCFS